MIITKLLYEKHFRSHNASCVILLFILIYCLFAATIAYSQVDGTRVQNIQQLNGEYKPVSLPAEIQWISEPWYRVLEDENAQMPYLAYMPEKDRVVMMVVTHHPTHTAVIFSDDHGKTWSKRKWLITDTEGLPKPGIVLGMTNLGGGKLLAYPEDITHGRWLSTDFGETWNFLAVNDSADKRYIWDPMLVEKDSKGHIKKIFEASWRPTGVEWGSSEGFYSQGYFRSSMDEGVTWNDEVKVPQWLGVNEVNLIKAANGDFIAACRTDYPKRFAHHHLDQYGGLSVSISKDKGKTWSELNPLYEWGRHHPSMVLMPNGDIVMTYVVRLGYPATHEGYPQFGVEAVVSHDNGQTWDKEHRYILSTWVGNITGATAWFCSAQSTSTVLLPDGILLTAYGTGFRNSQDAKVCKMDVKMARWRLNQQDLNKYAVEKNNYEFFVAPSGPQNIRNSEAAIVHLKDGSILLAWTEFLGDSGADHAPAHISGKISTDEGRTWGEKFTLIEDDKGCNVMEVNFMRLASGKLAIFYCHKYTESTDCRVMMRTSFDEGKTWINPQQLSPSEKYTGLTNGRSIRLRSGRILLEAWEGGYNYCILSDDDGKTWRDSQHIKPTRGDSWENACIELKDGRVMMLMRTGLGGQYKSISSDGGETWSNPIVTQLTGTAAPVSISRIPETGDLLSIWTHNPGADKRNPLTSAISKDEGETWENFRNLEDVHDDAWAYPAVTWIDNRALITYFNYKGGQHSLKLKSLPLGWFYK